MPNSSLKFLYYMEPFASVELLLFELYLCFHLSYRYNLLKLPHPGTF